MHSTASQSLVLARRRAELMLMSTHRLEDRYFTRMKQSINSKAALVEFAKPGTVLDVGAGGPELALRFKEAGFEPQALDVSIDSIRRLESAGIPAIHGNAENIHELVKEPLDNIVFSSILHEVFSYAHGDGRNAIREALRGAFEALKPGGRLLIRDGVRTDRANEASTLIADDQESLNLIEKYLDRSPLVPNEVALVPAGNGRWSGTLSSTSEVMNTINWGSDSLPRECQELFGVFTLDQYLHEIEDAGFINAAALSEDRTYKEYLKGRAHVEDAEGNPVWVPVTAYWVATKPAAH